MKTHDTRHTHLAPINHTQLLSFRERERGREESLGYKEGVYSHTERDRERDTHTHTDIRDAHRPHDKLEEIFEFAC